MSRSYYVIELSARWLTVLLVALALVMVLAFALGYGAAWSVLSGDGSAEEGITALRAAATPTEIPEVVIPTPEETREEEVQPTPEPEPTATPSPEPTAPPTPRPTGTPPSGWPDTPRWVWSSQEPERLRVQRCRFCG